MRFMIGSKADAESALVGLGAGFSTLLLLTLGKYPSHMATVFEIEKLALDLPERDRATLASSLLESLPPILDDEDEGIAEALRRDAEMDANPTLAISFEELDARIRNRHQ